jgi:hypothetical protein
MIKVVPSSKPIVDPNLCPIVWRNISGETHRFESYLEERYPGQSGTLVANPIIIIARDNRATFLPHAYYRHFSASGRPIRSADGRFEPFDPKRHGDLLKAFVMALSERR